ncbi:hypothetical protein IAT40_007522 [Kwoniella sp. CBS 6097]
MSPIEERICLIPKKADLEDLCHLTDDDIEQFLHRFASLNGYEYVYLARGRATVSYPGVVFCPVKENQAIGEGPWIVDVDQNGLGMREHNHPPRVAIAGGPAREGVRRKLRRDGRIPTSASTEHGRELLSSLSIISGLDGSENDGGVAAQEKYLNTTDKDIIHEVERKIKDLEESVKVKGDMIESITTRLESAQRQNHRLQAGYNILRKQNNDHDQVILDLKKKHEDVQSKLQQELDYYQEKEALEETQAKYMEKDEKEEAAERKRKLEKETRDRELAEKRARVAQAKAKRDSMAGA